MSAPAPKPFSLQAPERIAMEYGGNKQKIAQAVQSGLIDPTSGLMAGMFIDRMRSAQVQEQAPNQTVAQQVLGPQGPQGGPPPGGPQGGPPPGGPQGGPPPGGPQGGPPPQGAPQGGPPPPPPPQGGPPPQGPVGMAEGGLTSLPVPDYMFDEQTFAGGGIVAFAPGGSIDERVAALEKKAATARTMAERQQYLQAANALMEGQGTGDIVGGLGSTIAAPFKSFMDYYTAEIPTEPAPVKPKNPMAPPPAQKAATSLISPPGQGVLKAPQSTPAAAPRVDFAARARDVAKAKNASAAAAKPEKKTDAAATPAAKEETREELQARIKTMMGDVPVPKGTSAEDKAARKKEDFWSAMAQAGFGMMAGTSQNALTNIGEGLKAAMPTMQAALKERRADEKEERAQQYSYELAKYGANKDSVSAAMSEFRDLSKQKQEERLALMRDATDRANAQLQASASRYAVDTQRGAPTADMKEFDFIKSLGETDRELYYKFKPPYNPAAGFAGTNTALSAAQTALQQAKMFGTPADVSAAQARVTQLMSMQESMLPGGGNLTNTVPYGSLK